MRWDLCVITDRRVAGGLSHAELAKRALAGGARMIQLRDKEASMRALLPEALQVAERCRSSGATFIVNDRLDLALAVGADGVHLGQEDLPAKETRRLLGEGKLLGISTHSLEQALKAQEEGADYIGVGPIFRTGTKEMGYEPIGPPLIREVRRKVTIPILAIGGITLENVSEVIAAGADGAAVISAIAGAPDITAAVKKFLKVIRQVKEAFS
ncbi:MAG: thiamine phosphate synthase [candidate division NC10 bacterium]|nr:thiamine phosphate synthase [candidate division NC10 bacterium]